MFPVSGHKSKIAAVLISLYLLLIAGTAVAAVAAPMMPRDNFNNSISGGLSVGVVSGRDADFWGWSAEYGRRIGAKWSLGLGLAWDRETESFTDKPNKEIATYTASGTVSYALSKRWALTTGLGFGIADDDNPAQDMEFSNGDVSTALIATYATAGLPFFEQDAVSFSLAAEYNISQREPSVSIDVLFGWSY